METTFSASLPRPYLRPIKKLLLERVHAALDITANEALKVVKMTILMKDVKLGYLRKKELNFVLNQQVRLDCSTTGQAQLYLQVEKIIKSVVICSKI